jgi:hypothetical protein
VEENRATPPSTRAVDSCFAILKQQSLDNEMKRNTEKKSHKIQHHVLYGKRKKNYRSKDLVTIISSKLKHYSLQAEYRLTYHNALNND